MAKNSLRTTQSLHLKCWIARPDPISVDAEARASGPTINSVLAKHLHHRLSNWHESVPYRFQSFQFLLASHPYQPTIISSNLVRGLIYRTAYPSPILETTTPQKLNNRPILIQHSDPLLTCSHRKVQHPLQWHVHFVSKGLH